jgi:hypothetical protein
MWPAIRILPMVSGQGSSTSYASPNLTKDSVRAYSFTNYLGNGWAIKNTSLCFDRIGDLSGNLYEQTDKKLILELEKVRDEQTSQDR